MTGADVAALTAKIEALETQVVALHADTPKVYTRSGDASRAEQPVKAFT